MPSLRRGLRIGAVAALAAGLLLLGLSRAGPLRPFAAGPESRFEDLRDQAEAVRFEFGSVLSALLEKTGRLPSLPAVRDPERLHAYLGRIDLRTDLEGVAVYRPSGELVVWRGRVFDAATDGESSGERLLLPDPGQTRLIVHKASAYLVSRHDPAADAVIVFFRLLSTVPQFKTAELRDFHFLPAGLLKNCDVEYWDFREDVSGFETVFARNKDVYLGQTRPESEVQTLSFPLRNEAGRIVATVTLTSPSPGGVSALFKERLARMAAFLFLAALAALFAAVILSPAFLRERSLVYGGAALLILSAARLVLVRLGRWNAFRNFEAFSPAPAGFASLGPLTRSPADIFLTALFAFAAVGCALFILRPRAKPRRTLGAWPATALGLAAAAAAFGLLLLGRTALALAVHHSNLNLLEFSPRLPLLLIQAALWLFMLTLLLISVALARIVARRAIAASPPLAALVAGPAAAVAAGIAAGRISPPAAVIAAALIAAALVIAWKPPLLRRVDVLAGVLIAMTAFPFAVLVQESRNRDRGLMEGLVRDVIVTQEDWAAFFTRESLPELDRRQRDILTYFRNPAAPDFAHGLWEKTLLAKFNWYSGIEVLDAAGASLSSFSLNIPRIPGENLDFPASPDWRVLRHRVPFFGKVKEFLVGYRDWFEDGRRVGRTAVLTLLDDELLPFLYSANPYFEILRLNPLPSLAVSDFAVIVFDADGRAAFNPRRLSAGLPAGVLAGLAADGRPRWTVIADRSRTYDAFAFVHEDRVYALCLPRRGFVSSAVAFIRLLLLDAALTALIGLALSIALGGLRLRNPLRSFSSRVFISFAAVAFIPLLLVGLFSRGFFDRIFTQTYIAKAETYAHAARNIMDDFLSLQPEDEAGSERLPEDMVYWIGATIGNDISLYREGRVLASSRREFFDAGLLPDLMDGDIHYALARERAPVATFRQKIGDYSFQNLAIPYVQRDALLFISLPFPFERQEVAGATRDFIESLFFITVFFTALALVSARTLGRMIVAPVRKLLDGTRRVGQGDLEVRVRHASRDEMKTLIDGFNAMVESLKNHQAELAEMSKKAAWAEMARKVAHEVKNPLTPIQLSAEHLLRVYADGSPDFEKALRESVSYITSEVDNLRRIAREFLESSRETLVRREPFDVLEAVRETTAPYREILSDRIALREEVHGAAFACRGDKVRFKLALRNVLINALEAIPGRGAVTVAVARSAEMIEVRVEDSGVGMAPDVLARIFEPYFSTKETGTGLGLAMAKKAIEEHGGTIEASSRPGAGTRIVIRVPCLREGSAGP
jgi:signal transduction histidine kinase